MDHYQNIQVIHIDQSNSYLILDEKIAIIDILDDRFQWIKCIEKKLDNQIPDYLISFTPLNEDDQSLIYKHYPNITLLSLPISYDIIINLGKYHLHIYKDLALCYESFSQSLFSYLYLSSADHLSLLEGLRYNYYHYFLHDKKKISLMLEKVNNLHIKRIYPKYGHVLIDDILLYLHFYKLWSHHIPEENGIVLCFQKKQQKSLDITLNLSSLLHQKGENTFLFDLDQYSHISLILQLMKYDRLMFITVDYNQDMKQAFMSFVDQLQKYQYQNRMIGWLYDDTIPHDFINESLFIFNQWNMIDVKQFHTDIDLEDLVKQMMETGCLNGECFE